MYPAGVLCVRARARTVCGELAQIDWVCEGSCTRISQQERVGAGAAGVRRCVMYGPALACGRVLWRAEPRRLELTTVPVLECGHKQPISRFGPKAEILSDL